MSKKRGKKSRIKNSTKRSIERRSGDGGGGDGESRPKKLRMSAKRWREGEWGILGVATMTKRNSKRAPPHTRTRFSLFTNSNCIIAIPGLSLSVPPPIFLSLSCEGKLLFGSRGERRQTICRFNVKGYMHHGHVHTSYRINQTTNPQSRMKTMCGHILGPTAKIATPHGLSRCRESISLSKIKQKACI